MTRSSDRATTDAGARFPAGAERPRQTPPPVPYAATVSARSSERDGPPTTRWVVAGALLSVGAVLAFSIAREPREASIVSAALAAFEQAPPAAAAAATASGAQVAAPVAKEPPPPAPAAPATVAVARGDTLWHLAGRHLGIPGRWPALHRANQDCVRDPDLIHPGQELRLPPR